MDLCPCGTGASLAACCGRFVDAGATPATAEQLMRSRYTAYVLRRALYLTTTWDRGPRTITLDRTTQWLGLTVVRSETVDDDHAVVEFIARFRESGRVQQLHETSRFVRRRGRWLYVDGDLA